MIKEIHQIIGDEVEIESVRHEPASAEPNMGLFGELSGILQDADPGAIPMPLLLPAVTDARIFSRLGIQTYGFTPMKLPPDFNFFKMIHAADERIPSDAVAFGADAIYELLNRYKG